jgi:hypothetical protein
MPTVFLSYRRSDTGGEAGRLADTFQQKLGEGLTFRDVSNIPLGEQFDAVLRKELWPWLMLVLIGPTWLIESGKVTQRDVATCEWKFHAGSPKRNRFAERAALPTAQDLPEELAHSPSVRQ